MRDECRWERRRAEVCLRVVVPELLRQQFCHSGIPPQAEYPESRESTCRTKAFPGSRINLLRRFSGMTTLFSLSFRNCCASSSVIPELLRQQFCHSGIPPQAEYPESRESTCRTKAFPGSRINLLRRFSGMTTLCFLSFRNCCTRNYVIPEFRRRRNIRNPEIYSLDPGYFDVLYWILGYHVYGVIPRTALRLIPGRQLSFPCHFGADFLGRRRFG